MARFALHARFVASIALLGYALIARIVDNLYPFSTFSMYATRSPWSASRILARDDDGRIFDVDAFRTWDCPTSVPLEPSACPAELVPFDYIPQTDRQTAEIIVARRAPGGESVEVIRRVWLLSGGAGPPGFVDCVLLKCRAVRR
jgi:hypothetical protein